MKDHEKEKSAAVTGGPLQKFALAAWAVLIIVIFLNRDSITAESILHYTPSDLWLAALVMMGLFALKTLSIVFYSGLLFIVSGMLFDLPVAICVNICGCLVMFTEGYLIGRAAGSSLVVSLTEKYEGFRNFTGIKDSHPFLFALLLRTMKVVNYDLGSMYMGAAGVSFLPFLGGSLLAMAPELTLFALAGAGISDANAMPVAAAAVLYAVMTIGSVLILRRLMKKN